MDLTGKNTKCYGVTIQNNRWYKVENYEVLSDDEKNFFSVKPLEKFLVRSQISDMTLMSGALNKSVFNGISILLKLNEENDKHWYLYSGGNMISPFTTNDNIYKIHLKYGK